MNLPSCCAACWAIKSVKTRQTEKSSANADSPYNTKRICHKACRKGRLLLFFLEMVTIYIFAVVAAARRPTVLVCEGRLVHTRPKHCHKSHLGLVSHDTNKDPLTVAQSFDRQTTSIVFVSTEVFGIVTHSNYQFRFCRKNSTFHETQPRGVTGCASQR
jgi:hypothetical protein